MRTTSRERQSVATSAPPRPGPLPAVLTVLCALSGDGTFQATQQHVPRGEPAVRHLLFHKQGELCLGLCGRKETAWEINYCVIREFSLQYFFMKIFRHRKVAKIVSCTPIWPLLTLCN